MTRSCILILIRHASCSLRCEESWTLPGCLVRLLICGVQFVKVSFDSFANSFVFAFAICYPTDVRRVKPQLPSNAGEEPSLCEIGAKWCHPPCHFESISQTWSSRVYSSQYTGVNWAWAASRPSPKKFSYKKTAAKLFILLRAAPANFFRPRLGGDQLLVYWNVVRIAIRPTHESGPLK